MFPDTEFESIFPFSVHPGGHSLESTCADVSLMHNTHTLHTRTPRVFQDPSEMQSGTCGSCPWLATMSKSVVYITVHTDMTTHILSSALSGQIRCQHPLQFSLAEARFESNQPFYMSMPPFNQLRVCMVPNPWPSCPKAY